MKIKDIITDAICVIAIFVGTWAALFLSYGLGW